MIKKNKIILASVLIANYNKEKYISRCLTSLVKQNCKNFEVIFFDDKSTDNSISVVKKFTSKLNIRLIINKKKNLILLPMIKLILIIELLNMQKVNLLFF